MSYWFLRHEGGLAADGPDSSDFLPSADMLRAAATDPRAFPVFSRFSIEVDLAIPAAQVDAFLEELDRFRPLSTVPLQRHMLDELAGLARAVKGSPGAYLQFLGD